MQLPTKKSEATPETKSADAPIKLDEKRALRPLAPSALALKEHATHHFTITLAASAPIDDTLRSDFWANVADRLRQGDLVDVHWADGSGFAELLVRHVGIGGHGVKPGATVRVLRHVQFDDVIDEPRRAPTHVAKFLGPNAGWGVLRISDQKVVAENIDSREQAENHVRALSR